MTFLQTSPCPCVSLQPRNRASFQRAARAGVVMVLLSSAILGGCASSSRPSADPAQRAAESAAQLDRASLLVREAQRFEVSNDDTEAISRYREAIGVYRELPVAWNNLGRLLAKRGENLAAAEAYKTSSELSPTDPRPLHNLGVLWEELGYLDDAARWYTEALKRDENYLPALRRMLIIDETRSKPDDGTFERIRRATLLEQDPWWLARFKRAKVRLEDLDQDRKQDAMVRPEISPR